MAYINKSGNKTVLKRQYLTLPAKITAMHLTMREYGRREKIVTKRTIEGIQRIAIF